MAQEKFDANSNRPYRRYTTEELQVQLRAYRDSIATHWHCGHQVFLGKVPGCVQYDKNEPNAKYSCAEDLMFLYSEIGRVYAEIYAREDV